MKSNKVIQVTNDKGYTYILENYIIKDNVKVDFKELVKKYL